MQFNLDQTLSSKPALYYVVRFLNGMSSIRLLRLIYLRVVFWMRISRCAYSLIHAPGMYVHSQVPDDDARDRVSHWRSVAASTRQRQKLS